MKSVIREQYKLIKKCNYCQGVKRLIVLSINKQNLVKCSKCGLIYLDKQRIDVNILYNKNYYKNNKKSSIANYSDYANQEKVIRNKFKFAYYYIYKNATKKSKLLEIGAGYGFFLKYLQKNLKFYAVEISKLASKKIIENDPSVKVYNIDFTKVKLEETFDFIVSFDTIEHQTNLKKYLNKVHSLLNREEVFIFTTPDYGTIFNKMFGVHAPTIQPLYHNYYFDQKWIKENLPKLGFKIIYLKTTHFEPMNIGTVLLYLTFAIPFLKRIHLLKFAKFIRVESIIIPFIRFGGLECIVKKI